LSAWLRPAFPLRLPWLPLLAPLAVFAVYLLAHAAVSGGTKMARDVAGACVVPKIC